MKKSRKNPPPPDRMPSRKTLGYAALVAVVLFAGVLGTVWLRVRQPALRVDRILAAYQNETHRGDVSILYPLDQTVFPPEIVAPTFRWEDSRADAQVWLVVIDLPDDGPRMSFPCDAAEWTPAASDWQAIKRRSLKKPAKATVLGINRDRGDAIVSAASISISTSRDQVGAPIFYREVDLPFLDAVRDERFINEGSYIRTGWHSLIYNDYDLALEAYQKALKINPRSAAAHEGVGSVLLRQNKPDEARDWLFKALALEPDRKYAHFNLGLAQVKLGNLTEALRHHREAVRLDPADALFQMTLGTLLLDAGQFSEAQPHLTEAARFDTENSLPHVYLGIAWLRQAQPERAVACFQDALKIDSECVPALLQLASLKATIDHPALRDRPEAIELAQRACELTGRQDPAALLALAIIYREVGRVAEAIQTAETALAMAHAAGNQPVVEALRKRLSEWGRR